MNTWRWKMKSVNNLLKSIVESLLKLVSYAAIVVLVGLPLIAYADSKVIRIGWTSWADAEVVTHIAKQVLEKKLNYKVELVMTDIGLQYNGISKGNINVMLMSWQPIIHKQYIDKFRDQIEDYGAIYTNAHLSWVVPAYVPESQVKTIDDLKKQGVAEKFGRRIQGIDPGSGLMRASAKTINAYQLSDYSLMTASEASMISAVDRAIKRKEWIVATAWSPHWIFSKYQLRDLNDPKKTLGEEQTIHAMANKQFSSQFPKAAQFLRNFKIPLQVLEKIMLDAKNGYSEKAAATFINTHPDLVKQWLN